MKTLRRAVRSSSFDRRVNTELYFDSEATADAVLLVSGIAAVVYLIRVTSVSLRFFTITGLLEAVIFALIAWLLLAGGTWLAATKMLSGDGQLQTMMRLHGHCELPLLLAAFGGVAATIGLVWSLAIKVRATGEAASLPLARSAAAVLIGLALVLLVRLIFRLPFVAFSALF